MREQLIQYVELLFAGAKDCEDIKQEILQNTLDRYDDLIAEGRVPEAAYRLAITGIGDINEILGTKSHSVPVYPSPADPESANPDTPTKKLLRAIAVGLYILCPLPLLGLSELGMDTLGLCGTLAIVAVATVLIILGAKKDPKDSEEKEEEPKSPLHKSVSSLIWAFGLGVYFLISFATSAWHITWVIFPILGALDNLAGALISKNDARCYETSISTGQPLRKTIAAILNAVGIVVYFVLSFTTRAWYITWLVFPIIGAVRGLVSAILDLKEAMENEA